MKEVDPSHDSLISPCTALGRSHYKVWVLFVILLLAFWSLLSASAWIAGKSPETGRFEDVSPGDEWQERYFDVLDLEFREKLTSHMWDKYRHSPKYKLNSFWLKAFEAAYEELDSDLPAVRQAAMAEIAKLSTQFFTVDFSAKKPNDYRPEQSLTTENQELT